ncbi:MAG: UDP-N-acetylmuramoyl-L-alanyl-D-glutamate--2,6-diaminopimelate ligase [Coxiella sp. RIFCSPHIGHO2_12_FULL_42_15]|nr:MAG: UDP-N-acetylmuramoyl-L-alanyl-D-glutamate--2,6-diaminopimelate ligase [Coxiella sp. RIFCSPHIGHO2_12_FULL_42_15]
MKLLKKELPLQSKTLKELQLTSSNQSVSQLALDSRAVIENSLFFAYPGVVTDGRQYIDQAIAQGAVVVLYENSDGFQPKASSCDKAQLLGMPNLQTQVGLIASRFFDDPSRTLNIIGVTGTNGKTSITHFIAQAFQQHGYSSAVLGTIGNGIWPHLEKSTQTTLDPIQLQKAFWDFKQRAVSHVAMEVSSHALVQGRVTGTHFTTAVFTQLSRDHLDYHGTMERYAQAKQQLFQQPQLQNAIINQDDLYGRQFIQQYASSLNVVAYSATGQPISNVRNVIATRVVRHPQGFLLDIDGTWGSGKLLCPLLGDFNISNVLATLAVLLQNEIPLSLALDYCARLQPVRGRMQLLGGGNQPLVIVDYAHTPDALEKALNAVRFHCKGKLWCVFGCGGDRDKGKRPLMANVAERLADCVIVTDDNPRTETPQAIVADIRKGFSTEKVVQVIQDRQQAIAMAVQSAGRHDMVLVAGKGHETTQTIGLHVLPFDDVEQVQLALANRNQGNIA